MRKFSKEGRKECSVRIHKGHWPRERQQEGAHFTDLKYHVTKITELIASRSKGQISKDTSTVFKLQAGSAGVDCTGFLMWIVASKLTVYFLHIRAYQRLTRTITSRGRWQLLQWKLWAHPQTARRYELSTEPAVANSHLPRQMIPDDFLSERYHSNTIITRRQRTINVLIVRKQKHTLAYSICIIIRR